MPQSVSSKRRTICTLLQRSGALRLAPYLSTRERILMYHRVTEPELVSYPLQAGMFVRPESFRLQLRYLRDNANVISLRELLELIFLGKKAPRRTVVITFDDGWLDNLENAVPLLKEFEFPATIFLPTAFIGSSEMFWTDSVAVALRRAQKSGESLSKLCDGRSLRDRLPIDIAELTEREFRLIQLSDITEALEKVLAFLFSLSAPDRAKIVEILIAKIPAESVGPTTRSFLNWLEVRQLLGENIEFGCHSHRHLLATELSEEELRQDTVESLATFKQHGIEPLGVYCYPRGNRAPETDRVIFEAGFSAVLTTERPSSLKASPIIFGRVGIHDDISATEPLFASRLWVDRL